MPPRINLLLSRSLAYNPKPSTPAFRSESFLRAPLYRPYTDSKNLPKAEAGQKGPNEDTQEHVSEEAAKTAKIMGNEGPDLSQGTPIEEAVKGDKKAQENLPKVMQKNIQSKTPSNSRSFSTSTRRRQLQAIESSLIPSASIPPPAVPGAKFGLPGLPIPREDVMKYRYHDVVEQVTNLIMRDGKKSEAQRHMSSILGFLRTSPPPIVNPARPMLPGAPPPSHLPLNPVLYLTLAIDSVAPLMRMRSQRGAAGGGVALMIPVPLRKRQRRRVATQWVLNAATKRRHRGSGKDGFAQRVAEELIAVVEGKSTVWQKRAEVHKQGVAARANISFKTRR